MTPLQMVGLVFGLMLLLMALRVPIAIAMFVAGAAGYSAQAGWSPLVNFLNYQAFARFASYDLSVIPLFLLMGHLATQGGLSRALFDFASRITSGLRGGLAMAAVLASAAFGAICGSSVATAATITSVAMPAMRRHGYSGGLATGTLAAGGTLGILIPPSVPLVIYAILAEQNIAKLFAAAIVPGLIAMLGYLLVVAIVVRLRPEYAPTPPSAGSLDHQAQASWSALVPIAIIFTLVFGGIYGGIFTPTEGASVGAFATLVAVVLQGELTLQRLANSFLATAQSTAMIFLIFLGADLMNAALALTQVPTQLAGLVQASGLTPLQVVMVILMIYIVLGAVMDELSMLLLTIPIFFPIVNAMDFGLPAESVAIWFGILVLSTVGFGMLAPPVGLNVYIVNSMVKDVPISESYRGVMPFLISDIVRMALLLAFPGITLWLVGFV
jgi:C4-dicarboxylate transporter DctM subunit